MSKANISRIENSETPYTQDVLETLALALNTEPASFLVEDPMSHDEIWQLLQKLRRLPPATRRQAVAILETFTMTGTDQ